MVALITIAANGIEAIANFLKAEWVKRNSRAVGFPDSGLFFLGIVKGAAAVGIAVGLFWRPIGVAAAIGLVLFYVLATAFHVRGRVFYNIYGPLTFLALAVATLWPFMSA